MVKDIYFATKRLSIGASSIGGYCVTPEGKHGLDHERLDELFKLHDHVTLIAEDDSLVEQIFEAFKSSYTIVAAAGGVVRRKDEALMIHRNGRWDIPKGHHEAGETIEECAVREVEEESGVRGVILDHLICETLHAYHMHGRWELKQTYWYAMHSDDTSPLKPQQEEGIERAEWVKISKLKELVSQSFPTIRIVIEGLLA